MRYFAALLCCLSCSPAFAEYATIARKDGAVLNIGLLYEGMVEFRLSVGVAGDEVACSEGNVDCLTVEGEAPGEGPGYWFTDPMAEGSGFSIYESATGFEIRDVSGDFGAGTANRAALAGIAGFYRKAEPQAVQAPVKPAYNLVTPSKNIQCALVDVAGNELRCDMGMLTPSFTRKPDDCPVEWGSAFGLKSTGEAEVLCFNDAIGSPRNMVLDYGLSVQFGAFACTSEKTGLTCANPEGHGFKLSKAAQTFF